MFTYSARTHEHKPIKGKVEATNLASAAAVLREKGFFIISVKSVSSEFNELAQMFDKVTRKDVVNLTRQLATMITAGLTLTESFAILQEQSKPAMSKVVGTLRRDIEGGSTFADALAKHKSVFSRVYIALVRSGESAGVLDQVLRRLADNLEKQAEFVAKTKGALIYPVIVVIAMLIVAFIMMAFVVPKLTEMYADFGAELPAITQVLIKVSNAASTYWYVVIAGSIGLVYALFAYKKTPMGDRQLDAALFKIPIYGLLRVQIMMTEFSRTISLLLGAGVSLLAAMEIVADSMESVLFRDAMREVSNDVEKGVSFSDAMNKSGRFPPLVGQMIAVGEETGKMDEVLVKLSGYYESESEHAIKNLSSALEPIIMIVLGVGVGFLIVAIVMPIYNLTSQF